MPKISRQSYEIVVVAVRQDHVQKCFCIKTLTIMVLPVYKAMSSLTRFNQGPPNGLHGFMVGSSKQSQKQFGANKKKNECRRRQLLLIHIVSYLSPNVPI